MERGWIRGSIASESGRQAHTIQRRPSRCIERHGRWSGAMERARRPFPPIDFTTRFPALDGLRALAVTMVFALHYGGGLHGGRLLRLANAVRLRGWMGVDLFFVLSGFLITGVLYDTRSDSGYFRRFFARRALRIFPVFYLTFAVILLLTPVFQRYFGGSKQD